MAKKTNPTPAKTATKKTVTMAERVKRIELDVNRHGASMAVQMSAMREHVDLLHEDTIAQIESNRVRLIKIERLLSTPQDVTGAPADIPEQGVEPGDYTDASKEVADKLTAMGYEWYDDDRYLLRFIEWGRHMCHKGMMVNKDGKGRAHYPQAEFLARAAVTAKKLGLVAKEEEPWKPEVGQHVKPSARANEGWVLDPLRDGVISGIMQGTLIVEEANGAVRKGIFDWRYEPMSPEEVAKYHADIEAAKPIVPYKTRAMYEGYEYMVIDIDDGKYLLHHHGAAVYQVPREAFKVIDP